MKVRDRVAATLLIQLIRYLMSDDWGAGMSNALSDVQYLLNGHRTLRPMQDLEEKGGAE